jgi:hypothetical protein
MENSNEFRAELHAHPFFEFERYSFEDVINKAGKKNLDFLALGRLDNDIYPELQKHAEELIKTGGYISCIDNTLIRITDKRTLCDVYIPRMVESRREIDVLTIGKSSGFENCKTVEHIINKTLEEDEGNIIILDHPFVVKDSTFRNIDEKTEQYVEHLCKKYSGHVALELNGYCVPWMRKLGGLVLAGKPAEDCNKKVIELSERLKQEGYNAPAVSDIDGHFRYKWSLNALDKAAITFDRDKVFENASIPDYTNLIGNMKKQIMEGNYKMKPLNKIYVGPLHQFCNFALPVMFSKVFKDPRA